MGYKSRHYDNHNYTITPILYLEIIRLKNPVFKKHKYSKSNET